MPAALTEKLRERIQMLWKETPGVLSELRKVSEVSTKLLEEMRVSTALAERALIDFMECMVDTTRLEYLKTQAKLINDRRRLVDECVGP